MKCDNCLNARRIISENGFHSICCLSDRVAMNCLTGKGDYQVPIEVIKEQAESEVSDADRVMRNQSFPRQ